MVCVQARFQPSQEGEQATVLNDKEYKHRSPVSVPRILHCTGLHRGRMEIATLTLIFLPWVQKVHTLSKDKYIINQNCHDIIFSL